MAKYQVMYWKEIPAQIKVMDENGQELSLPLSPRFQEVIDQLAMENGELDSDSYLDHWHWGETLEIPGTMEETAQKAIQELEQLYPTDPKELIQLFRKY